MVTSRVAAAPIMQGVNTNENQIDTEREAVALIAHDAQKLALLRLVETHRDALEGERLIATGTTGRMIQEHVGLDVECAASGPLGGDLQIGALIATGHVKLVIFLRDPLHAHPHEPDIQALFKICDTHRVPLATNTATGALCLSALHATDAPGPLARDVPPAPAHTIA